MDPEFRKILTVVLAVGTAIGVIGFGALFFIFRAFGGPKAGGARHNGLIAALLVFVFACCAGLLILSYSGP